MGCVEEDCVIPYDRNEVIKHYLTVMFLYFPHQYTKDKCLLKQNNSLTDSIKYQDPSQLVLHSLIIGIELLYPKGHSSFLSLNFFAHIFLRLYNKIYI